VEDWKRVLWSDETKITGLGQMGGFILGSRRGTTVRQDHHPHCQAWRRNNLMVWGCMGWNGVGKLTELKGIMDGQQQQYWDILDDGVWKVLRSWRYQRRRGYSSRTMTPNTL